MRAHNEPLETPAFAEDGGEEAEVAGLYIIDQAGTPRRLGFAIGNEFSDHVMERRNYLYLAPSKIRTCALGPELALGAAFDSIEGTVTIERNGAILWQNPIATGEAHMVHALANLEATLKASAMSLKDVVMVTVTLAEIRDYQAFDEVFRSVFKSPYPARTISGAPLADPDMLVEIETISVAGGGRPVAGSGALPQTGAASPAMLAGEHLYIGAQTGVAADGSTPRGAEAQTRAAWQRIEAILAEVGMDVTDVVRTNNWLTDWRSYAGFNAGFGDFVVPPFPPRTTVIGALTDPHACVQVEAVGHRLGRYSAVIDVNHGKKA